MPISNNTAIGLDIGQTSTKLVVLRRNGDGVKVVRTAVFSSWEEGLVNEEELAEHLGPWLHEQGIGQKEAVIGVPQYLAIAQLSDFPPASSQQLDEMVALETQQLAGLSDEAFLHDYRALAPFGAYQNPVLIGVCKESAVRQRLKPLLDHNVNVADMAMEGQALAAACQSVKPPPPPSDKLTLVLDIGAENTTMAILQNGQSVYLGSFMAGGLQFTNALMRGMGLTEMEAERTKRTSRINPTHLDSPLTQAARAFTGELQAALENWHAQGDEDGQREAEPEIPVEAIYLSGGGARLAGLDEFLALLFDCEVKQLTVVGASQENDAAIYNIAYGLALQALAPVPERISLAPRDVTSLAQRKRRLPYLVTAVMALAVGLTVWLATSYVSAVRYRIYLNDQEQQLAECSKLIDELQVKATKIQQMQDMLVPFVARGNRNATLVTTTNVLSEYMQDKDWLVFLADEDTYYGSSKAVAMPAKAPAEGSRPLFMGVPSEPSAQQEAPALLAASVKPWQALVASGFTPMRTDDPWRNLRMTVDSLNNQPDSIFIGVDSLPESSRSVIDFRIIPKWKQLYGMRSFAIRLPLRTPEFVPPRKEAK